MALDFSVFDKVKSFNDYNQLEEEFQLKKQLAIQGAQQQALQQQLLVKQITAPEISAKDLMVYQGQREDKAADRDVRKDQIAATQKTAEENNLIRQGLFQSKIDADNAKRQEKKDMEMGKAQGALDNVISQYDKHINDVDELLKMPGLNNVTGMVDGRMGAFSPTQQNAINKYDTIVSSSVVGGLQDLKNSSPTGASGFGSLTEKEGDIIKNAQGTLQRTSDEKTFRANAEKYRKELEASRDRVKSQFNNVYGKQSNAALGLPPGASVFGTSGGKPIYKLPDGSFVMEQ